jgi:hypothetical protein
MSLPSEVALLEAIVDELAIETFSLVGISCGGCIGAAYSTRHPERVSELVIYAGYAEGAALAPAQVRASLIDIVRSTWGFGSRVLMEVFMPGADADERREYIAFQRAAASADVAADLLALTFALDARGDLARVQVPTTVVHRTGDRTIPFLQGREVATAGSRRPPGPAARVYAPSLARRWSRHRSGDHERAGRDGERRILRVDRGAHRARAGSARARSQGLQRCADRRASRAESTHRAPTHRQHTRQAEPLLALGRRSVRCTGRACLAALSCAESAPVADDRFHPGRRVTARSRIRRRNFQARALRDPHPTATPGRRRAPPRSPTRARPPCRAPPGAPRRASSPTSPRRPCAGRAPCRA